MQKAKKYDWKDSNMSLFGSDTEKQVKKESAESEPAWKGAGQAVGLKIWRIVKFKVTTWDEEDYGKFYEGDSYIILNTYKEEDSDALLMDVHFWIGKYSSQDEYGTAAYKTVELDTLLDDKPIQHREVQNHESSLFRSYFKDGITLLKGGADTGFRRVLPEEYKPRLFQIKCVDRNVVSNEIACSASSITEDDVFIFDIGLSMYQYNGGSCNVQEKFKASTVASQMKSQRPKAHLEVVDGPCSKKHEFWARLPETDSTDGADDDDVDGVDEIKLLKVNVESRESEVIKSNERIFASDLVSDDVFIVDTGDADVFVWVGKEASIDERKNGMAYAHKYMQTCNSPLRSISIIQEGQKSKSFALAIAA